MKKRIMLISLAITLVGLSLLMIIMAVIFHSNMVDNTVSSLKVLMLSYERNEEKFLAHDKAAALSLSVEVGGNRVTFIGFDGEVLSDSEKDNLGNHIDREEVVDALKRGEGTSIRKSETLMKDQIYYCKKYETCLVRIGVPASSVLSMMIDVLPLSILMLLIDVILCVVVSQICVKQVLKPVEEFSAKARQNNLPICAPYEELEPLARIITDMKKDMNAAIDKIKEEQLRETIVLDNMEHGFIILKSVDEVLLINKAAKKLLNFKDNHSLLLYAARDNELMEMIEHKKSGLVYRDIKGGIYAIRIAAITEMDSLVMLITDVTIIQNAQKSKDEFISNVTHEMNTPLTAILGFSELMASGKLKGEKLKEATTIINTESARLQSLVKNILNYSAVSAGVKEKYELDFSEVLMQAVQSFEGNAKSKNISLKAEKVEKTLVLSRTEWASEVARNLISNAIRYTNEGEVRVSLSDNILTVTDSGIGIAKDKLPRIFDRFYTVDTSHSGEGFGLGLAIVKKVAEACDWKVEVSSKQGNGTTFRVIFK